VHGTGKSLKILAGLAPAAFAMGVLFIGALGISILQSIGYAPAYGVSEFPTLRFYGQVITDEGFLLSLGLTFYYAIVPTVIGAGISLLLALVLLKNFKGKGAFLFLYKIPMVVPYLVGVSLVILLFSNGGLIARLFYHLGLIGSPSDFVRLLGTSSGYGIFLVYLWKQVPFMTVMLYAHLLVLDHRQQESAYLLGANRFQSFMHVTLPGLAPALFSATLIVFAFNFGGFEVPFILGAGYPNTLTVEAWRLFDDPDYTNRPAAMALTTLILLLSSFCLMLLIGFYRYWQRKWGRL